MPRVMSGGKIVRREASEAEKPFQPEERTPLASAPEATGAEQDAPAAPPAPAPAPPPDAKAPPATAAPANAATGTAAGATTPEETATIEDAAQPEAGAQQELPPEEEEEEIPEEDLVSIGDRVEIQGMVQAELLQLNGMRGTVVDIKPHGLHVRVDGRGKWLVLPQFLEKLKDPVVDLRQSKSVCIVGTWDDWKPRHAMTWDAENLWYKFKVEVGKSGEESFQIMIDGEDGKKLHPDKPDSNPFLTHNLCGPDSLGDGKNWTIGKHQNESQSEGICYEVRLFLKEDGSAKKVEWVKLIGDESPPQYESIVIVCSCNDWKVAPMVWDADRRFFHYPVKVGRENEEGFQLLVDENFKKCFHPDINDACGHIAHRLCGPDQKGHGLNWTIGKHRQEGNVVGFTFDVRLHIRADGTAKDVNWHRIKEPLRLPKFDCVFIVGTFNKWKVPLRMSFDKSRRCFHYKVKLDSKGHEDFQLVLDGSWEKCLYPDREDANQHNDWNLCGADGGNHGKNWTIGRHPKEQGKAGESYEVRLWLTEEGRALRVDWAKVTEEKPAAAAAGGTSA